MTAVALRALPVPDCEPPDDPAPARHRSSVEPAPRVRAVQGVLSLVVGGDRESAPLPASRLPGPSQQVEPAASDPHHHRAATLDDEDLGPGRTATAELPAARDWGRLLTQVVVEVMCSQRPASQLLRHTSQQVYDQVVSQTLPPGRRGAGTARRPRVTSVHVCEPADGVAEVGAVVHGQYRVQALALRLEGRGGRWRVTALECG